MKNILKKSIAVFAIAITLISCSKSENPISGTGNLKIQFENGFANNELILGSATAPTSQNEVLKISSIKYIVSNIVLTKTDGTIFVYPKSQSYFIVNQEIESSLVLNLDMIPAGDYKSIKFGIGVDEPQYNLGQTSNVNLWMMAQNAGMTMNGSWISGFKFVAFEGAFTSPTVSSETSFMIHTGKTSTNYNYSEVVLELPTNALVRTNITPQIHLSTDLSQIIDGNNKIDLSNNAVSGIGIIINSGINVSKISANVSEMFSVEHVHNDPN